MFVNNVEAAAALESLAYLAVMPNTVKFHHSFSAVYFYMAIITASTIRKDYVDE